MPSSINDYRQLIEKPWGKMFYDMIFRQLDISDAKPLHILDFGAGFCVTASHYAEHHKVIAVEPSKEMLDRRLHGKYKCIHGGIEVLKHYDEDTFDLVICHNVLEYASGKEQILKELARVLKQGGRLSIVKHNLRGRILACAVFSDDPKAALDLLDSGDNENNMFGKRDTYDNEFIIGQGKKLGLSVEHLFGIRTFFAMSSNNEIKFTKEWQENMLELEMRTCDMEEYKNVSFFHHVVFGKGV